MQIVAKMALSLSAKAVQSSILRPRSTVFRGVPHICRPRTTKVAFKDEKAEEGVPSTEIKRQERQAGVMQGSSIEPLARLGNVLAEMNKEMNHFMSSFNVSPTGSTTGFSVVTPSFFDSLLFPEQLPRSPTSMMPHPHHFSLAVEEDDSTFMLSGQVEDYDKEDIKVTLEEGNILTIKGFHKTEEGDETKGTKARMSSSFVRRLQLAEGTDFDKIEATMKDGFLKIMVPKAPAKEVKEIKLA